MPRRKQKMRERCARFAAWSAAALLAVVGAVRAQEPPAAPPARPVEDLADYRIGTSDLLDVDVFGVEDLTRKVRVLRDGTVSLPLVGPVEVAGLSLDEAERKVARILAERRLVKDPHVTIFVEEYMSRGVSVQGAVERPGVYQMLGVKTLLEILGEAGGISGGDSQRAGAELYVVRADALGGQERLVVDVDRLFSGGDPRLNIPLKPGDVVVVPFAERYRVYVSGAVASPGAVEFLSSDGITVLQAITAAGGPSERANLGSVFIKRRLADGGEEQIELNLRRIRRGKDPDVPLLKNDTVIVGDWFF